MKKAEEYFREEYPNYNNIFDFIKQIQEEAIRETVQECANSSRIKIKYNDVDVSYTDFFWGIDKTFEPDKNSILSIADKLIKEL